MALRAEFKALLSTEVAKRAATGKANRSVGVTVHGFGTGSIRFVVEVRDGSDRDDAPLLYESPVLAISVARTAAAKQALMDELANGVLEELTAAKVEEGVR